MMSGTADYITDPYASTSIRGTGGRRNSITFRVRTGTLTISAFVTSRPISVSRRSPHRTRPSGKPPGADGPGHGQQGGPTGRRLRHHAQLDQRIIQRSRIVAIGTPTGRAARSRRRFPARSTATWTGPAATVLGPSPALDIGTKLTPRGPAAPPSDVAARLFANRPRAGRNQIWR